MRTRDRYRPEPTPAGLRPAPADLVDPAVSLPVRFWWFAAAAGLCTAGLITYGLIGYHLVRDHLVGTAAVPLLYAAALASAVVAALFTGLAYDRSGPWTLLALPIMVAAVPVLTFGTNLLVVVSGILLWGAAARVQDSSVKALVADLVPRHRRATVYGLFAAVQGVGALAGGVAVGALYQQSRAAPIIAVAVSQVVALLLLLALYAVRSPATQR